jgi:uncharacterized membrane protein
MSDQFSTTSISSSAFQPDGRTVEANRGVAWLSEGWNLFTKNPGVWIGQMVVLLLMFFILGLIPLIGALAINLLAPVFGAGLILGCRALQEGGTLEFNHLFEGFKQKTGELILIGVLLLVGSFIIMLVAGLIMGSGTLTGMVMGHTAGTGVAVGAIMLGALVALALSVPLAMASWFAVPLVLFHDIPAFNALRQSFFACLKNMGPFLLFGLVAFVLAIIAAIPFMLGFLVLGPVLVGAAYAGYRDIFLG